MVVAQVLALIKERAIMEKWFVFGGVFSHGDFQEMEPLTGFCEGPYSNKQEALAAELALIRKNIDICWYKTWIADVTPKNV